MTWPATCLEWCTAAEELDGLDRQQSLFCQCTHRHTHTGSGLVLPYTNQTHRQQSDTRTLFGESDIVSGGIGEQERLEGEIIHYDPLLARVDVCVCTFVHLCICVCVCVWYLKSPF